MPNLCPELTALYGFLQYYKVLYGTTKNPETIVWICFPAPDADFRNRLEGQPSVLIKQRYSYRKRDGSIWLYRGRSGIYLFEDHPTNHKNYYIKSLILLLLYCIFTLLLHFFVNHFHQFSWPVSFVFSFPQNTGAEELAVLKNRAGANEFSVAFLL